MPMNQNSGQQDVSFPLIMQAVSQMAYKLAENAVISMDEAKALTDIVPQALSEIRKQKAQEMQQQQVQQQQAMTESQGGGIDRMLRSASIG